MDQTLFEQIEKASDKASVETAKFILGLKKNPILGKVFQQYTISEEDRLVFINEITYIALGIRRKEDLIDNILVGTIGNEENILRAIDDSKEILNQIPNPNSTTKSVLEKEESDFTKMSHSDVLSEIENPKSSLSPSDFVLPKTKPSTVDILKNMGTQQPLPPDIDLSINTDGIIDPLKVAPPTTPPSQTPTPYMQTPPPTKISTTVVPPQPTITTQMDSKLGGITGSVPKESFKIMPLTETLKGLSSKAPIPEDHYQTKTVRKDPYREPIEPHQRLRGQ